MNQEKIGKLIALKRKEKGMTQDELAEKLFVSRQTVSNYETGRSKPDIDTLVRISGVLGADVQELLYGPAWHFGCGGQKNRLQLGLVVMAVAGALCVLTERAIGQLRAAPDRLYLYLFQSGVSNTLWLILQPCFWFIAGWVIMQGLSMLPGVRIRPYGVKWVYRLTSAAAVVYFCMTAVFCGWMLVTNWQSYQHALSDSTEEFYRSFYVPVVMQCIRLFANHRKLLWAVFIPAGMLLWLSAGTAPEPEKTEQEP